MQTNNITSNMYNKSHAHASFLQGNIFRFTPSKFYAVVVPAMLAVSLENDSTILHRIH